MAALDILKEWSRRNRRIENVVLFVSDALRWDFTPDSVLSQGVAFRAVASGIRTPISFPSIITGLYPPRLGVYSFYRRGLPGKFASLLNLPGYNTSLWTENCWTDYDPITSAPLYKILGDPRRVPLEEIQPPFVFLEDEKGGHCPYGWSLSDREYEEGDCLSFFRDLGKKETGILKEKYRQGAERTAREFTRCMRVIDQRGIAERTLIVFMSDHGESLGEHGIVAHDVTTPEVVYVPIVFIHPDLPKGLNFEKEGIIRHIDLYPTIMSLLRREAGQVDGLNLFDANELPPVGLTYYAEQAEIGLSYQLTEVSVWDKDGGYMFRKGLDYVRLALRALYITLLSKDGLIATYQRARLRTLKKLGEELRALRYLCCASAKWGSPSFGQDEARSLISKTIARESRLSEEPIAEELPSEQENEQVKARLKALGYID